MRTKPASSSPFSRLFHTWRGFILMIVGLGVIVSCIRIVWRAWQVEQILQSEQIELQQLEHRRNELLQDIQNATSSFELERRARDELLLQASGEAILEVE